MAMVIGTCSRGSLCSCRCSTASPAPPHTHILVIVDVVNVNVVDVICHLIKDFSIWPSVVSWSCDIFIWSTGWELTPSMWKRCCQCLITRFAIVFINFHGSIAAVMFAMGVQLQVVFNGRPRDVKVMPAPDLHLTSVRKKELGIAFSH